MATRGVTAKVVTPPTRHRFEEPLPAGGDAVCIYAPTTKWGYFYGDLMSEIVGRIDRRVVWLPRAGFPMLWDVFNDCSHYIRLCEHDGFSNLSAEFMMAGKVVITNQDQPYQVKVEPTVEAVLAALESKPHRHAPAWYREATDKRHVIEAFQELIDAS
jgi:hypothetical protein